MKYEKEVDQLLKEHLREDWMNDGDYEEALELFFEHTGFTKQEMSDNIETGVENGFTFEQQKLILDRLFKYNSGNGGLFK